MKQAINPPERQRIDASAADLRKYRTELPNLLDDAGLNVYEFRLLAHYYRRGLCWESRETTAELCKMSTGSVTRNRESLRQKGFITLERVKNKHGGKDFIRISVVDKWAENFLKYSSKGREVTLQGSPDDVATSSHDHKEEPFKKEPIKSVDGTAATPHAHDGSLIFKEAFKAFLVHVQEMEGRRPSRSRQRIWRERCGQHSAEVATATVYAAISSGLRDLYPERFEKQAMTGGAAVVPSAEMEANLYILNRYLTGAVRGKELSDELIKFVGYVGGKRPLESLTNRGQLERTYAKWSSQQAMTGDVAAVSLVEADLHILNRYIAGAVKVRELSTELQRFVSYVGGRLAVDGLTNNGQLERTFTRWKAQQKTALD